jgi:hypothetical protein
MPYGIAAAAVIGGIGSVISSGNQAGAAEDAAGDQEQAALAQLSLSGNIFNAQGALSLPTREVGGLAQSREAYLLGLTPDLDISPDFSTPNIQTTPTGSSLGWYGPASGDKSIPGSNPNQPNGGNALSAQYPFAPIAQATNANGAIPNPNAIYGSGAPSSLASGVSFGGSTIPNSASSAGGAGAYGSFASPYNPSTFYEDPGYNFIKAQGQQQISNQQATTGLALSPSSLTAALQYNSGLASQEFNNAYNRSMNTQTTQLNELNALSSGGQIATSGLATNATSLGAAGASALSGYGNAGAAGAIGVGNANASGINGLTNSALSAIYGGGQYGAGGIFNSTPSPGYIPNSSTSTMDLGGNQAGYIINTPD